jgi:hypothetical protein
MGHNKLAMPFKGMKAEPTTHNLTLGPRPQADWDQALT